MNSLFSSQKVMCLVILVAQASAQSGQNLGPNAQNSDPYVSQFTLLGVTLGKSTLKDVQRTFGDHPIVRYGEGGDATSQICISSREGHAKVVFSSGPSGGWQTVTNFDLVSAIANRTQTHPLRITDCHAGTFTSADVGTTGGLKLGLTI